MTIEFRHLRYFLAASEYGSFRKAGVALGIQESAISRRVRDLEDQLGASLFNRHSGGVSLTLAGQCFAHRARKAIEQIGSGASDVAAAGRCEVGRIRIGIVSLASGFLAELLNTYGQRHAGVHMDFIDDEPDAHAAALRRFDLDVAFVTGTREWLGCETTMLWSEQVFAALPDKHRLTANERLGWHDLASETVIVGETPLGTELHQRYLQGLAGLGQQPKTHCHRIGRDNLLHLVGLGCGLALTSEATTAAMFPGVVYRPIVDGTLSFSAVWSSRNDNPAFRRLLSMAKTMSSRIEL